MSYTALAMPIYEFGCSDCRRRTSVFVRSIGGEFDARCEHCGGANVRRLVSRVAVGRGASTEDGFDERLLADVDEHDPRSMARFARRMRDEMGEDLGPDFDEAIEQMEAGQLPDDEQAWLPPED